MLAYADFKKIHIVRHVMGAMDAELESILRGAGGYAALRTLVIGYNGSPRGRFAKAARHYAGVCSSGERLVLLGLLTLCDFASVADEIADAGRERNGGAFNQLFGGGDDDTRAALGACIANAFY